MTVPVGARCISLDCAGEPRYFVARLGQLGMQTVACRDHIETAMSGTGPHIVQGLRHHALSSTGDALRALALAVDEG